MIVTDAHTHIYRCHDLNSLMFAAFSNLFGAAAALGEECRDSLLFLTETRENSFFSLLQNQALPAPAHPGSTGKWEPGRTDEKGSLLISHADFPGQRLFIIAGRQVVTREKIEVLALAFTGIIDEQQPLEVTVASILAGEGIAVLPWGVGKWLGKRRKILQEFLQEKRSPLLFLGDNGARPRLWPKPALLKGMRDGEMSALPRVLSGSDPLPLPGEEARVGSFGSIIHATIDPEKPAESIRSSLADPQTVIDPFGPLQPTLHFFRQQLALRMNR